ncbi:MAG: ROK family protein [Candidatus Nanopelagicales bacterium]
MTGNEEDARTVSFTIGLDIGGTHVRCLSLVDGIPSEIEKTRTPRTYDELLSCVSALIDKHRRDDREASVGIGLPGRTDPEKPIWIPALPFLNQSNFTSDLAAQADCSVTLINDAQAALVGETRLGAARGSRNSILVTLGTGIGGAIMIDGKIYVGHNGVAGSFGWLLAPVRLHPSPEHGPWERWSSGTALATIARNHALSIPDLLSTDPDTPAEVVDAADDFASRIGKGLGSLAALLDPQVVIVSGGLVDSWERLKSGVVAGFMQTASPSVRKTPIRVGKLGSTSGAIGAAFTADVAMSGLTV